MAREVKQTNEPTNRPKAGVEFKSSGEAGLVQVIGLVDEHFRGFGALGGIKTLVIDVSGMTRMTSFGVRQWLKAMDGLPKSVTDLYLLGCPTFFVDQLNMVLNFGGTGKVLTVMAPYTCPSCGMESGESIDVLNEGATLAKGGVPEKECGRCSGKLEFDETPESYFSFAAKYAATNVHPAAAQLLAQNNLYIAATETPGEKPPRITKLVHGPVTYFRIIGSINSMFRARPFLVGAEGEVVIDLAEVDKFDPLGLREWRRMIKSLVTQVPYVTLVDVNESLLTAAPESLVIARNIAVASLLVPYFCTDCGKTSLESHSLQNATWPFQFPMLVCSTCGGTTQSALRQEGLAPLQKASTAIQPASVKVIEQRQEILSRAVTDANVASAGEAASVSLNPDDTILGKYKIVRRLSAGGMAEVFLAKQVGIGGFEKPVALKRILRQLLESRHLAVDMFLNEAKIAGRLMHPNIVQVHDVGQVGGALYLAMEYVHGKDLREVIRKLHAAKTIMPLGEACYVITQIAQALHHAYWSKDLEGKQHAVIHRDVSPHNVILGYDGIVKLLDFGVAMSAVTEQAESMIAGKWAYMSPEHTTNQQIDHRSDLFSVGVMMYLLFTGKMPFSGSDPREIVKKIRAGQYKPLKQLCPDLPDGLTDLVGKLLSPKSEDRPRTGQEVVNTINEFTRSYGIDGSAAKLAAFLKDQFGDELEQAQREIQRGRPTEPLDGLKPVNPSSGSIQAQLMAEDVSPGKHTPSFGPGIDQSFSLSRRSGMMTPSGPMNAATPDERPMPPPAPPLTSPSSSKRILLVVLGVIALAGLMLLLYSVVKPQ
jgi:serine/threonine protein kinase